MKYIMTLLVILTSVLCFQDCHSVKVPLNGPEALETLDFRIPTGRDTTIETKNGALLNFPEGSLDAGGHAYADIEIREAFTMEQIILGGLTTSTNGIPLSSGGMIYVNAKAGQQVSIRKPIRVAIPATHLQEGMQLYKGEMTAEGKINWTDPADLPANPQARIYDEGNLLYGKYCANCHQIGKEATGPDLAHFLKIFGPLGEGFIGNSPHRIRKPTVFSDSSVLNKTDTLIKVNDAALDQFVEYTPNVHDIFQCNLIHQYGSIGPVSALSVNELEKVYAYIQQESDRLALPMPYLDTLYRGADSCEYYHSRTRELQEAKMRASQERNALIKDNGPLVIKHADTTWPVVDMPPPPDFDQRVSPQNYDAVYYQFTIDSFGWFNIDMLAKGVDGVQESELFVRVQGQYHEKIKMYLIIPSVKVYGEGGPSEKDPAAFAFFYKNGKLPLPQGAQAFILAISESEADASVIYGITAFRTSRQQELNIELHQATRDEFRQAVSEFEAGRLYFRVTDTKNADSIRAKDTLLRNIDEQMKAAEKWKPRICDCDCGINESESTGRNLEK